MTPVALTLIDAIHLQSLQMKHNHGVPVLEADFSLLSTARGSIVTSFTLREWSPETVRLLDSLRRSMETDAVVMLQAGARRPSMVSEDSMPSEDEGPAPGTINELAATPGSV